MSSDVKLMNRATILTELLASSPTTRTAIVEATGLSGATVTRTIDALTEENLVRELTGIPTESRGRPPIPLEVIGERSLVLGVDLGASNTRLVVADLTGRPVLVKRVETPVDLAPAQLGSWLAELLHTAASDLWPRIEAVALGLPGAVNPTGRVITNAPHLPQVEGAIFLTILERELGLSIEIDNDANYALLGEAHFGAARRSPNAVMFTLGAGLGAGISIDGHLQRGSNGLVGEFGSLPIGPLGSRLEHLVTGRGIMLRASELGLHLQSPADIFAATDDKVIQALRVQFEQALLVALTAAIVSCDPETIVLGGGIAPSLRGSTDFLRQALIQNLRTAPVIVIAELGDLSGALGAAVQALHKVYLSLGIQIEELPRVPARRKVDLSKLLTRDWRRRESGGTSGAA